MLLKGEGVKGSKAVCWRRRCGRKGSMTRAVGRGTWNNARGNWPGQGGGTRDGSGRQASRPHPEGL